MLPWSPHSANGQRTIVYAHLSTPDNIPHVFPWDYQGLRLEGEFPQSYDLILSGEAAFTLSSGSSFGITPSPSNAVMAVRSGPYDLGGLVVPMNRGQEIGPDAGGYGWMPPETSPFGPIGSTFTASRASGIEGQPFLTIGYFTGLASAYAGLRFQQNGRTHYGWARVGAPAVGMNGGWVYDYAYETRPDTPILAGNGAPALVKLTAIISGVNEAPTNNSVHQGTGSFTLQGNSLAYDVRVDAALSPTSAAIHGPASAGWTQRRLIANLNFFSIWTPIVLDPSGTPITLPDRRLYQGQIELTETQVAELLGGRLYVSFSSAAFPRGEVRGQIVPVIPIELTASLSSNHEALPRRSPYHGAASFTLTGDTLHYKLALDSGLGPGLSAAVYGAPGERSNPRRLLFRLDTALGILIPEGGIPDAPGVPGQVLYSGTTTLTDIQTGQLTTECPYINVATTRFPRGEIAGIITLADGDHDGISDYVAALLAQGSPCNAPWHNHAEYVKHVTNIASQLARSGLISCRQLIQIVKQAQRSNCGNGS